MKFKFIMLFFVLVSHFSTEDNLNLNLDLGIGVNRILQTVNSTVPVTDVTDWNSFLREEYLEVIPAEFLSLPTGTTVPLETLATLIPKVSSAVPDTSIEFLRLGSLEVPADRLLAGITAPPYFHANDVLPVNEKNARRDYLGALVDMRAFVWGGTGGPMFDGPTRCNRSDPRIRSSLLHQYLITFENLTIPEIAAGQPVPIVDLFGNMKTHFQFVQWYLDNHATDPDEINHYTKLLEDAKQRCERIPGLGDPTTPPIPAFPYEDPDTCL